MPTFGRVLTALATPMTGDRKVDFEGAQHLAAHLIEHGSDGLVVAGSTGESPTLSHDETLRLFRAVVEAVGGRGMVVAGTGKNDTAATVELTREATAAGVDGIMVVTPYYNKPPQRGLVEHFTTVAGSTDLPVLLYNIPSRTSCEIQPDTLLAITEQRPNVRGVKDAVGDFAKAADVVARAPEWFEVYSGDDINLLPLLAVGGVGVVSVAGHLVGEELQQLIDVFPTDPSKALQTHLHLLPLFRALFVDTNPVPLKAALALVGLPGGPVRPPLADATDETVAAVREALVTTGVLPAAARA